MTDLLDLPLDIDRKILLDISSFDYLQAVINLSQANKFFRGVIDSNEFCCQVINKIDASFTTEDLDYCKNSTAINNRQIIILFKKLAEMEYHDSGNSNDFANFILNLTVDSELQKITYRLVMCSDFIFNKFSSFLTGKAQLIRSLGIAHGIRLGPTDFKDKVIIEILFDNQKSFDRLTLSDWQYLFKESATICKRLLLEKPDLSRNILKNIMPYEITSILTPLTNVFFKEDLAIIKKIDYRNDDRYGYNFGVALDVLQRSIVSLNK
jgi:hypothetical protein